MTTERQRSANQRNASKSTGPRGAEGKRRAAKNARTHGLNLPPDQDAVLRWVRIIRGNPEAARLDNMDTVSGRATVALAEAEAHLERTRSAERDHLEKMFQISMGRGRRTLMELAMVPEDERFQDDDVLDRLISNYSRAEMDEEERDFIVGSLKIFKRSNPNRPAALARKMQTLRSYRMRAEGRRNRAFSEWLAAL